MLTKMTRSMWMMMLAVLAMSSLAMAAEPEVGKQAPAFELKDIDGNSHKLSDFAGKIVVLHFQGKNCPWDRAYQAQLNDIASKYASTEVGDKTVNVQFLAINANHNETAEQLKAYHEKAAMSYPILKDPGNKVADAYAARTTPHIYIIDGDGALRYKGGIEKAPVSLDDVSNMDEQYLQPVLSALVHGKELPATDTVPKGCGIKREKK